MTANFLVEPTRNFLEGRPRSAPAPRTARASSGSKGRPARMSTLAATKADGFYYPPDWTPEGGSASLARKFNKNGSLGKRANKLNEGKLTVRFEMPYNVGCRRCGQMIARGVRFNAEKKMVGKYHSTPIYAFTMLSRCCANRLEIHTDPKEAEYIIVSGADRKIGGAGAATRYNDHAKALDAEGTTEIELQSREDRDAMMADPMGRLERTVGMVRAADVTDGDDPTNASTRAPATFIELRDQSKNRWKDDYEANRTLRRAMRGQRKEIKALKEEGKRLNLPEHVKLLPRSETDAHEAREAFRRTRGPVLQVAGVSDAPRRVATRAEIEASSIFSGPGVAAAVANRSAPRLTAGKAAGYAPTQMGGGSRGLEAMRTAGKRSSADSRAAKLARLRRDGR